MAKIIDKIGLKHGNIMGVVVTGTNHDELINWIDARLENKEKFYIVTPNPEIVLMATKDWLLEKSIRNSDVSVPDGVGLKYAFKYLHGLDLNIIKGRELFIDIIKICDKRHLRVCLVGGENDEALKTREVLMEKYKNLTIQAYKTPIYNRRGQPATKQDRKVHKLLMGKLKIFEPDFIFVALGAPKQEKWIYRNFFRTKALGAMAVGGTFNFVSGGMSLPPQWMEKLGLEWVWRFVHEPSRFGRIFNAVVVFPWQVFLYKVLKRHIRHTKSSKPQS